MKLSEAGGDWALVTGASSGLGREFAIQLAGAGMNVVLVARGGDELEKVAQRLREQSHVQTRVVALDLAVRGNVEQLRQQLAAEGIRVRLLCNNAGLGRWGKFEAGSASLYQEIIDVNTAAMVAACHHFMPDLASFPSSAVINVSSQAGYHPIPYMNVYAASKAFVHSFSQALHCEWRAHGILVQMLVPGPTESAFDQRAGAYDSALTTRDAPAVAVAASLKALAGRRAVVVSARGTLTQRLFATLLPSSMFLGEVAKRFKPPH